MQDENRPHTHNRPEPPLSSKNVPTLPTSPPSCTSLLKSPLKPSRGGVPANAINFTPRSAMSKLTSSSATSLSTPTTSSSYFTFTSTPTPTPTSTSISTPTTSSATTRPSGTDESLTPSRTSAHSPLPLTRPHIVDAFRLRQYELDLLADLSCPECGVPPGSLNPWRGGIGAQCTCCRKVLEGPKLRDCLQPLMERHTQFYHGVRRDIGRCRTEIQSLGDRIDNLKAIIDRHRQQISERSQQRRQSAEDPNPINAIARGDNRSPVHDNRDEKPPQHSGPSSSSE